MFTSLSLRLRIFLFFAFLAGGGAAIAALGLWLGWSRAEALLPAGPFVQAFLVICFLNTGMVLGVWLLFDENVAKPIDMLATGLRLRAHSGGAADLGEDAAKYLGDLAPAASAVVSGDMMDSAGNLARDAARLQAETERLTAMLTEVPVATIVVSDRQRIVLYDGQASGILSGIAPPLLGAPIVDYFNGSDLALARAQMLASDGVLSFDLRDKTGQQSFAARAKPLETEGYMPMSDVPEQILAPGAARPLVYNFDLLQTGPVEDTWDTKLSELCFVCFDSETTGLSTEHDEVVQLGAVRVLNGRVVDGEELDSYVDPGRPIPPASTAVHKVSDADVKGAPDMIAASRSLHGFSQGAVLVAHNAPFDLAFLKRAEARAGLCWDHPVLDTVLLSAVVFGKRPSTALMPCAIA